MSLSWQEWVHGYFYRGRTSAVYLSIIITIASIINVYIYRSYLIQFTLSFMVSLFAYAVFTDLVSHLITDTPASNISIKEFIHKFLSIRTHDIYGLIMVIGMSLFIRNYLAIIIAIASALLIAILFKIRFYH